MFKIDEGLIKEQCLWDRTFERGQVYHRKRNVKTLNVNPREMTISGVVEGTRNYDAYVSFDKNGTLLGAGCDCPAAEKYWGFCKHIVALLLSIKEQDEKGRFDDIYHRRAKQENTDAGDFFNYFESAQQISNRIPVNLEITYEANIHGRDYEDIAGFLSIRMGEDRLYVVRSIPKVLEAIKDHLTMEFGKNFTYDPNIHTFSPEDEKLVDFLMEIYEVQKVIEYGSYYNTSGIFHNKRLTMTHALSRRFFRVAGDRGFNLVLGDNVFNDIYVIKEDLPIDFGLSMDKKHLLLEMNSKEGITPLTLGGEYILMGGAIYKPSEEQRTGFIPFYNTLNGKKDNKIRFSQADRERFVSEVLPFAQRVGKVDIKPEVDSIILREDLQTQLYLRPQGKGIGGDVKFIYGQHEINPFDSNRGVTNVGDQILVRDLQGEQEILNILDQYGFSVQPKGAYLEDEDKIYEFVYRGLPKIQEFSQVYYSEEFKDFMVHSRISYSGGIKLNTKMNILEFNLEMEGIDPKELGDVFNALREKRRYFRLKNGSFLNLEGQELDGMSNLMDHLGIDYKDLSGETIEIPKYRALFLDEQLRDTGIKSIRRNSAFKDLVSNIKEPGDLDLLPPPSLENILRNYQDFGFKWMKSLASYGMGGILADDMGLGKTLQVIALLLSDKKEKGQKPSLVIVPTSLVYNWEDEVEKFAPELSTLVLSGTKEERMEKLKDIGDKDMVITSYPLIRRDGEDLSQHSFRYCILDEAQNIKNPDSQGAKMVKIMDAEARFALTGTPMENTLSELWSIFDFIMPGYLFSHGRFKKQFESPIVKDEDKKASQRLSYHIKPFILRRLKRDVLKELPDKIEHKVSAELTLEQKKVYLAYMQEIRAEIEKEIDDKGFNRSHIKILAGLTRLRQICCHPSTFLENYKGGSGKLQLLEDIIDEALQGGHRILLFSQFTSMLAIIKESLKSKGIKYQYLDGSTPMEERGQLVRAFNGGEGEIFLISLKAGGTGLNLTGADTVIHFDPWWNPAVEDQATDRAHRIGQEKVVHVMKLITRGTIEEKIFALQQKKKELIDAVIEPGHSLLSKMTEEELRGLFAL